MRAFAVCATDISGGKAQRIPKALRLAMEGHR
jgi:hypothetical protein